MIEILTKKILPFLVILALVLGIVYVQDKMFRHRNLVDADYARLKGNPIPVSVGTVVTGAIQPTVVGSCQTAPSRVVNLRSPLNDIEVFEVFFKPGTRVKKGQGLLDLDRKDADQKLTTATAKFEWQSKLVGHISDFVDYYKTNLKDGLSLEREYQQTVIDLAREQRDLALASSEVDEAKLTLAKTYLKSPVSGIIEEIVTTGEILKQSSIVATISVQQPMHLDCQFDNSELSYLLDKRDSGKVSLEGLNGHTYRASFIQAIYDDKNPGLNLRFQIDNAKRRVMPGMKGVIRFESEKRVLRVPAVALLNRTRGVAQIFVVNKDQRANLREVVTGESSGGFVEIVSGLKNHEVFVIAGQVNLLDGDQVNPLDPVEVTFPNAR
jgi:RND family efflux transporter MFP subunit